jgi:hypothetical protein
VPIEANAGGQPNSSADGNAQRTNNQTAPAAQKYSSEQPRVSAGNPDGGQWTNEGDGGSLSESIDGIDPNLASGSAQYAALDTGTRIHTTERRSAGEGD